MKAFLFSAILASCIVRADVLIAEDLTAEVNVPFTAAAVTVPEGFTIELAAAPPLVRHPMMACFDNRGRLFVAESAGRNLKTTDLEQELPNFIRMLEDTNDDGVFDKSTIFADKMTFPQGALWHEGSLYVAAPPSIWRLTDTNGDGVADQREEIVNKFGYTGNAASIHGCFLGPGGRIYWCDGRHGHEFTDQDGNITSQGKAARIFSCKADGSDVQVHCGGGMDNPVEIDFTPEGEMLGTVNLFYRQRGDCLVHWMHGGVYPRYDQQQVVSEFKRTGDLLTEVMNLGHVAVSGTMRYRSTSWGEEYQDNFFISEFNTHRVSRAKLTRSGSTFRADREEFLSSTSPDFHPTDVLEDADGSLLVIDTGGWFRIGCPTSQIAKPNILGAIYRVRRTGAKTPADPRGQKIAWAEQSSNQLAALLGDKRFTVRERSIQTLAARDQGAINALSDAILNENVQIRRNAVWTLTRIDSPAAIELLHKALTDEHPSIRQSAAYSAGILHNSEAVKTLANLLQDDYPEVRRAAATALGRIGNAEAAPALLAAFRQDVDRVLEHALIYALIEINDRKATVQGLADASVKVQRAALIALDQMYHGQLTVELVAPLLNIDDNELQKVALDVLSRHDDWSDQMITLVQKWLVLKKLPHDKQDIIQGVLMTRISEPNVQAIIGDALEDDKVSIDTRVLLLATIARSNVKRLPESWNSPLTALLNSANPRLLHQTIATLTTLETNHFDKTLRNIANNKSHTQSIRIAAWSALAAHGETLESSGFVLLRQACEQGEVLDRVQATRALATAMLSAKQKRDLTATITNAGPLTLPILIGAYEGNLDSKIAVMFIAALSDSPGLQAVSTADLRRLSATFSGSVKETADELIAKLEVANQDQQAKLASLESVLSEGDPVRGALLFKSTKIACATCHRIDSQGGTIGPDLSAIGKIRTRQDLLEAVVIPSASLARGYQTVQIATSKGLIHSGVIGRETVDSITLRNAQRGEIEIARDQIEQLKSSKTSVMPQGLDQVMSKSELRDLLAFLESLK